MSRIIAIDGPSGSGKSTLAKLAGKQLGFLHVDSGALYRIITWHCVSHKVNTADPAAVASVVPDIKVDFATHNGRIVFLVNQQEPTHQLRTPEINVHASPVATVKEVRDQVTQWLRELVKFGNLIVEGRDITTVVFPETPARFYLVASAEARAVRRRLEEIEKGIANQSVTEVERSLLARDVIDSTRKHAPLKKGDGVIEIDNTRLSVDETVQTLINHLPKEWLKGV